MKRCIELALKGAGRVAPNPMVGSVLVHDGRIIGEGFHEFYGGPHAEVNCVRSVAQEDEHLVSLSTLYVSLEPCAHYGKTPPCTELILNKKIPAVVVGCTDPFDAVNGKGIGILRAAGVEAEAGVLEAECKALNRRFFFSVQEQRPYVILKWAATANG
ncbi:MAG TPA: bifunctional diaminohydroxyphosphoribosylaminopyrimidine deaminase/5-amino-6-(5-phosphoribosylamino)uracil reductase RibD, partial [Flavitalea sp.]|nr:bifunctional diaminohydroxyphosphoribosylaminopyrimidine deaminase/5-amino-6-(5-phosphoribosylamino)uracil reductase RibD [Flavitalea sp.]